MRMNRETVEMMLAFGIKLLAAGHWSGFFLVLDRFYFKTWVIVDQISINEDAFCSFSLIYLLFVVHYKNISSQKHFFSSLKNLARKLGRVNLDNIIVAIHTGISNTQIKM